MTLASSVIWTDAPPFKIDVTVNAPVSGKIVELLANEEDTVTVGQDLFRIEAGEAGVYRSLGPSDSRLIPFA